MVMHVYVVASVVVVVVDIVVDCVVHVHVGVHVCVDVVDIVVVGIVVVGVVIYLVCESRQSCEGYGEIDSVIYVYDLGQEGEKGYTH